MVLSFSMKSSNLVMSLNSRNAVGFPKSKKFKAKWKQEFINHLSFVPRNACCWLEGLSTAFKLVTISCNLLERLVKHLATLQKSDGLNFELSIWGNPNCRNTLSPVSAQSASSSLTETWPSCGFTPSPPVAGLDQRDVVHPGLVAVDVRIRGITKS